MTRPEVKQYIPFDEWYMQRHPDHCRTCLGGGKLEGRALWSGMKYVINCPDCEGTGRILPEGKEPKK